MKGEGFSIYFSCSRRRLSSCAKRRSSSRARACGTRSVASKVHIEDERQQPLRALKQLAASKSSGRSALSLPHKRESSGAGQFGIVLSYWEPRLLLLGTARAVPSSPQSPHSMTIRRLRTMPTALMCERPRVVCRPRACVLLRPRERATPPRT